MAKALDIAAVDSGDWLTLAEVTTMLQVSRSRVGYLAITGKFGQRRTLAGVVVVKRAGVLAWESGRADRCAKAKAEYRGVLP